MWQAGNWRYEIGKATFGKATSGTPYSPSSSGWFGFTARKHSCPEEDAYEADLFEVEEDRYVAIITDGKGEIPNGTKIPVPNHKLKWDAGNPTGHGIIFIGVQGQVLCYIVSGGV
jgi:hypothetical protein